MKLYRFNYTHHIFKYTDYIEAETLDDALRIFRTIFPDENNIKSIKLVSVRLYRDNNNAQTNKS